MQYQVVLIISKGEIIGHLNNIKQDTQNHIIICQASKNQWLDTLQKDFVIAKKIELSQAHAMMM